MAKVLTPENPFLLEIEELVRTKSLTYMDAVVHWCEIRKYEVEYGASMVKKSSRLKKLIREEAEKLNCMRKK